MDKIVRRNLKVDFHIHSASSKHKDGDKVKDNTIENIDVLISKLVENNVDMVSISDHDIFDYDLYKKLKEKEFDKTFFKVFPAVEFSVTFVNEKNEANVIHIVCVFSDEQEDRLSKLNHYLVEENGKVKYDLINSFSESKFLNILKDINLDVVMIAHQKGSIYSKNAEKNDVVNVGKWKLNEFISSEYFDSFEFRNPTNGIFNNLFKKNINEKYEIVRFITGSDCHDWTVYPKMDQYDNNCDYRHTYLKCLPVFRGVAMSLTDDSRISLNENSFSIDSKKIDKIIINNDNKLIELPLSHGINVIIGDNSIGKSLLLHKLNGFQKIPNKSLLLDGYNKYLHQKNIEIKSLINQNDIYFFDIQGSIRENFSSQNPGFNNDFLSSKYPADISSEPYVSHINSKLHELYTKIDVKFQYDELSKRLITIPIITEDSKEKHLSAILYLTNNLASNISEKNKIKTDITSILTKLKSLKENNITDIEKEFIQSFISKLEEMLKEYTKQHSELSFKKNLINCINLGISQFNEEMKAYKSDVQNQADKRDESIHNLSSLIASLVRTKNNISSYKYEIEEKLIDIGVEKYGKYNFIKRFANNISKIDSTYFQNIISRCLIKGKTIDTKTISKEILFNMIANKTDDEKLKDPLELLKNRISLILAEDFKNVSVILHKDKNVTDILSQGLNSTIYFNIISNDKTEGIYLVDQPEDDISQSGIRETIIEDFKSMRSKRQVIMVTHNPQFVVNLDADNVICIEHKEGKVDFKSGALEFQDSETNILKLVLEHLDGGLESIRKRWKRYEKNIEIN